MPEETTEITTEDVFQGIMVSLERLAATAAKNCEVLMDIQKTLEKISKNFHS